MNIAKLIFIPLVFLGAIAASAQKYDARTDFSAAQNPNGPWSYGWSENLAGPLNLFADHYTMEGASYWDDNRIQVSNVPHLAYYPPTPLNFLIRKIPPNSMVFHPGAHGLFTHCLWTAPARGTYKIQSTFVAVSSGRPHGYLLKNGTSIGDSVLETNIPETYSPNSTLLAAGDTIDAVVGVGPSGDYVHDETMFSLTIARTDPGSVAAAGTSNDVATPGNPVERLAAAFDRAQANALRVLDARYAGITASIARSYLVQNDAQHAEDANDWITRLNAADPAGAADGIVPSANSEDPLASLQSRYIEERTGALTLVENSFLPQARLMRSTSADKDTADDAANLAARIEAKLGSAATAGLPSGDAEALFAAEKQGRWKPQRGGWRWDGAILTGTGDSSIDYATSLNPPFVVQFTMTVIAGCREELKLDQVGLYNAVYQDKFGPFGGDPKQFFAYKHNHAYHCALAVSHQGSYLYVDGHLVASGSGQASKVDKITLYAGDGWSGGVTEWQDFIIVRGAGSLLSP